MTTQHLTEQFDALTNAQQSAAIDLLHLALAAIVAEALAENANAIAPGTADVLRGAGVPVRPGQRMVQAGQRGTGQAGQR